MQEDLCYTALKVCTTYLCGRSLCALQNLTGQGEVLVALKCQYMMQIWRSQRSIRPAHQHPTTRPEAWSCQSGALASSFHLLPSPGLPLLGHPGTWVHHRWCHTFNSAHTALCGMPCTPGMTHQEGSGSAQAGDQYDSSGYLNVLLVVAAAHTTGAEACSQDSSAAELWSHTLHRCARPGCQIARRDATSAGIACLPVLWLTHPLPRECMQEKLCRHAGHRGSIGSGANTEPYVCRCSLCS